MIKHKMYRSQLGAITEHHVFFHAKGAERKMNRALRRGSVTKQRLFKH